MLHIVHKGNRKKLHSVRIVKIVVVLREIIRNLDLQG